MSGQFDPLDLAAGTTVIILLAMNWGEEDIKMVTASNARVFRAIHILLIVVLFCPFTHGKVIHVDDDGQADFDTIQAGIDAANDVDTVLVAPGEYVITEPITFRGKAIMVKSEVGPDETTIRMGTPADTNRGSVVVFENGETAKSVLDGFTITGGRGSWGIDSLVGGGIFFNASSGTLRNCAIVQNKVEGDGGGVLCAYTCSPILIDCIIAENSAGGDGGGVLFAYTCSPILIDCIIAENSAELGFGGGVFAWSGASPSLSNCIIKDNSAKGTTYGSGGGGGVCCLTNASMTMSYCTIAENYSGQAGGGVFCGENSSSVSMTNCVIIDNTAGIGGGGLETFHQASATVTNCVIARNTAGTGGGIICAPYGYQGCSVTVTNSIIWGNNASEIRVSSGGTLGITYSNVDGGQTGVSLESGSTLNWGTGNINADPYFADPAKDDYHLKSQAGRWNPESQTWVQDDVTSPCIDTGDPMIPIGWELFPNGGFVNMGAYGGTSKSSKSYFGEPVCETIVAGDINGDGQVNRADLEIMALHWTDEEPLPLP